MTRFFAAVAAACCLILMSFGRIAAADETGTKADPPPRSCEDCGRARVTGAIPERRDDALRFVPNETEKDGAKRGADDQTAKPAFVPPLWMSWQPLVDF